MAKPIVKTVHAFDATLINYIEFTWSGNQAYNNRIVLYDAATQAVVYDNTYPTNYYRLNHEIPAYTLDNNKQYAVQISVIDAIGEASPLSDKYYFWTISTPDFYISNITDGETIYSPTVTVDVHYEQSGTETLNWTQFILYDAAKTVVTETAPDYSHGLSYTFSALDNKVIYYVRVLGETIHGMSLDTGMISFVTSYANPSAYARLYADPEEDTGFVNYYTNLVVIPPDIDDYFYEDGYIDLTEIDMDKVLSIRAEGNINTSMGAWWTAANGAQTLTKTDDAETGITVTGYRNIDEVIVIGNTQQIAPSFLGDTQEIVNVNNCTVFFDRIPYEDVTNGMRLAKLPINFYDYFIMKQDGMRMYVQYVGDYTFSVHDEPVRSETIGNEFITYHDIGALVGSAANNIFCNSIPVANLTTTSIELDSTTGYIKITWRSDSGVTTDRMALEYFRDHDVTVLYPLKVMQTRVMKPIAPHPKTDNYKQLRYSQNFIVPGETATFMIRMKDCRRSANLLKVYSQGEINFILQSIVYENNIFRLKLTVYNSGPNYIQYSDELHMDYDDVLTVYIRRVNGIYGLYTNIFEMQDIAFKNMWLGDTEPGSELVNLQEKDLWINLDGVLIYVPEEDVETYVQDREPSEASENAIWLGGRM